MTSTDLPTRVVDRLVKVQHPSWVYAGYSRERWFSRAPLPNERWLPVVGFEEFYKVSDFGRVESLRNKLLLQPKIDKYGYLLVILTGANGRQSRPVHRLVLEAFAGPRPLGMECCHWDDNPTDNRLEQLRWDTVAGNRADCLRLRDDKRRERNEATLSPFSVLTELADEIEDRIEHHEAQFRPDNGFLSLQRHKLELVREILQREQAYAQALQSALTRCDRLSRKERLALRSVGVRVVLESVPRSAD